MKYLVDTNILIYYFNGNLNTSQQAIVENIFCSSVLSIISKIEFLGWKKHTNHSFEQAKEFLKRWNAIPLDEIITNKTIQLKREHNIKLPDAVIAATALEYGYILVTRNENDFKTMTEMSIYNPFEE